MKKHTKAILIALCLLTILCVVAFAACKDVKQITVTVNANLDGVDNQTFMVDKDAEFFSKLESYVPAIPNGFTFVGWVDASGAKVTADTRWSKDGTVYASWTVVCAVEYYLETNDGFVKSDELSTTVSGKLGETVTAEQISITGYSFDAENADNVKSVVLAQNVALKLYYKRNAFTVTFDKNDPNASGAMAPLTCYYGTPCKLTENSFVSGNGYEFHGWNTKANGLGNSYTDGSEITANENITLYAQWEVTFTEEIWAEEFDGSEYVYVRKKESTVIGFLGNSLAIQSTYDAGHYFLDYSHQGNVLDVQSLTEGTVLKAYYSLERFTITYADDNTQVQLRYGEKYTIRTPENDEILSYCSSPTGDGTEYKIGQVVTINKDLTLYPVLTEVFADVDGSGDRVEIRPNATGRGAATLVKNGKRYEGFVSYASDSLITFDVTVRDNEQDEGVTYYGKLLQDGKFVYRNEEELGTYLFYDPLFPEDGVSPYTMLALDGYGTGVLSLVDSQDYERTLNYFVNYAKTSSGDYHMKYYLPADSDKVYNDFFQIVRGNIEGADELEGLNVAGYFMICGAESGSAILVYNGQIDGEFVLMLDGYGEGAFCQVANDSIEVEVKGSYYASENYDAEEGQYEYVFIPDNVAQMQPFAFIVYVQQSPNGQYALLFQIKRGEFGIYNQVAGVDYPELYLDGYGGAIFIDSEDGDMRRGSYTIEQKDDGYEVLVTFVDAIGGVLRVTLDQTNNIFEPLGEFEIENGVLTKYFGNSSVIVVPEGVTEIASGAFEDKNVSTLRLPSTIQKIGDYAFQNTANNGKSMLKTVYVDATTPPELGEDPFRWVTSEFKVVVPDGFEQAYRIDTYWAKQYPSATYADYVTSLAEIADKPEFEVKNCVLLSYNNKDDNPQNVVIVIPDEVTEIKANVFEGRDYIVSVNLNNVTVIGDNAFDRCVNLASVTFNGNTVSIGSSAFFGCVSLTEVDLGNVQAIGGKAFFRCYNLVKVNVGGRIESIGEQAFAMCAVEVDEDENTTAQNELIVTITAISAPTMSANIFGGSVPRIYVNSYEVGVSFAQDEDANWARYAVSLRVKNSGDSLTYYSVANMGDCLVLDDRINLNEGSLSGLYKWQDNRLYVAWFNRDMFTGILNVETQIAIYNQSNGELRGLQYDEQALVFVSKGTQLTYAGADNETLTVKFGTSEATFNGSDVAMQIVNYRMQFTYQGYVYHVSLSNTNEFSYTRNKVPYTKTYAYADGSAVTVTFGDSVNAIGTLKDVDGNERYSETGWSVREGLNGTYTWFVYWLTTTYQVTARFYDEDNTFTYMWEVYSTRETYRNGQDFVVVTEYYDGKVDVQFNFKTANGELTCNCQDVKVFAGTPVSYAVTIDIMLDVVDENGEVIGAIESEFNGDYTIVFNKTEGTYTLQ